MADKLILNRNDLRDGRLQLTGNLDPVVFDITEDKRLSCPSPLNYDLAADPVREGVLVKGAVATQLRCRCDRCLAYYDQPVNSEDVCHFYEELTEDLIDLTADIREDIVIAFPQKFLCFTQCKGICPVCGQNRNARSCTCVDTTDLPSAWNKLDGLQL